MKTFPITHRQTELLVAAQGQADKAQRELSIICATILGGLDIEGRVAEIDSDKNVITVEVADEPKLELEA